jgi:hypothetical protein
MTSIAEIEQERDAAVEKIEAVLFQVIDRENDSSGPERAKWARARQKLQNKINELHAQAFERALREAQPALDALRQVSGELQTAAGRMRSATEFLNALNDVLSAADGAIRSMGGPHGTGGGPKD